MIILVLMSDPGPYINTIPVNEEPTYPGDRLMERRLKNIIRWNAMAMVVRANRSVPGLGGHISTYASAATLYEVGFNHFFRAPTSDFSGDFVYFQGHAAPGIYSRAFLEGRLEEQQLLNFRRELAQGGGLSSYPHPHLMPGFWQFPTVSMGLGPLNAIYHARFMRYLEHRGLKKPDDAKIWAFLGDGETDEPESLGALSIASREKLDNLIFVINCNLQRLDGPVRGNGKIIQELDTVFTGAGWNVIKVIWGGDWDELLKKDTNGHLVQRMNETVDGMYQKYSVSDGAYIREHFFGDRPELLELVEHLPDEKLVRLRRGGHDPVKVYAAYRKAVSHRGAPTVILAKTIKGYGLGEAGEGQNTTHQRKSLNTEELTAFTKRFQIPVSEDDVDKLPFYRPPDSSAEMRYLKERRESLGGPLPSRSEDSPQFTPPEDSMFDEFYSGTDGREVSTTMAYVRVLTKLLRDPNVGHLITPIIPDEARTFGMDALFKQVGIYSSVGQLYEPVDAENILYYKESASGQILEEGINEAGAMASLIAAGSAYSTFHVNIIPFYTYYSMFGPQRVGDLIWAAADSHIRGFLVGATSGRTTLNGEGLQHQDGQSHILLSSVPSCLAYDPAFAYEIAVIIREGIRRMYERKEAVFYYLSVSNENYAMPPMPEGVEEGILKGMYRYRQSHMEGAAAKADILAGGSIMLQALEAAELLEKKYNISINVWSVTSFTELRREALRVERHNLLHPFDQPRKNHIQESLSDPSGVCVAVTDHMKALPDGIARWIPGSYVTLGTDGFGRSDSRESLRNFFEINPRHITYYTLASLYRESFITKETLETAVKELDIDPAKPEPSLL